MNLEQNPAVAQFLSQLTHETEALPCPICGQPVQILPSGQYCLRAICPGCEFTATVPKR